MIEIKQKQAVLTAARDCHDLLSSREWPVADFPRVYSALQWLTGLEAGIIDDLRSAERETPADTQPAAN